MLDLSGYKLTFDDEFNTRSISSSGDQTKWQDARDEWRMSDGKSDIGFGKSSFVDPASGYDPFSVKDGALTITAVHDRTQSGYPGSDESGLITTQGNFSQKYGYFEMRADLSEAKGGWDAFWLLPDKAAPVTPGGDSSSWQELDVVEHYAGNPRGAYSTIHTTDPSNGIPWQQNRQVYSEHDTSGYHTYGVKWGADKLDFYFDGQLTGSQNTPSDYKNPMYLIANLATQDGATDVGQNMKIDYIRAYSNDGSNPTVAAEKVSAPDGKDPGMYGATALNGQPPANNPEPVTQSLVNNTTPATNTGAATQSPATNTTPTTNPEPVTQASVTNTTPATNTGSATQSPVANTTPATNPEPVTQSPVNNQTPSATSSTNSPAVATNPTTGSTGPTTSSSTAPSQATSDATANPTAGSTTPVGSTAAGNGMASTLGTGSTSATGSSTTSGSSSGSVGSTTPADPVTTSTGAPGQANTIPTNPVPTSSTGASSGSSAGSSIGNATDHTIPTGTAHSGNTSQSPATDPTNAAGSTSTPQAAAPSTAHSSAAASWGGNQYSYRTFTNSEKARSAAMAVEQKINQCAAAHPEASGWTSKILEAMHHYW